MYRTDKLLTPWMIISLSLLWGCQQVPSVSNTPIILPEKMRSGTPVSVHAADFSMMSWWKKMHDPVLNRLIHVGLSNNNQLQAARASIQQAEAQLQAAHYAWLPTMQVDGAGFLGGGIDSTVTPQGPLAQSRALSGHPPIQFRGYFSGFVPKYSVNIWQNIQNTKLAKASLALQQANYQAVKLAIVSQICGAYFMLVGEKQQLADQARYLAHLRQLRQLEWGRYRAGLSDMTEVLKLDQQIASWDANQVRLQDSMSQVENAISTLLNQNPQPLSQYAKLHSMITDGILPKQLPASVLKNRPDVLMAINQVAMNQAHIGIAYAKFFPSISLTSLLGTASVDLKNLLSIGTGLWVAQGALMIPAINGVSWEKIKEAKAGYAAAVYTYLQTLRTALAEVDNSLTTYQRTREAYQYQAKVLFKAQKADALALSRYHNGFQDYRAVLHAQLNTDTEQLNLTLAKMQQLDSIVGVYQAVAAGINL